MKPGKWMLFLLIAVCQTSVYGDDLELRNGMIYWNYRVSAYNSTHLKITSENKKGSRITAVIAAEKLPLSLQRKYFWKNPGAVVRDLSMGKLLREFAEDLEIQLVHNDEDKKDVIRKAINTHNRDLRNLIVARAEKAAFKVENVDGNGAWLKVTDTQEASGFEQGQIIYVHGFKGQKNFYNGKVYPSGCRSNNKEYNNPMIYGFKSDDALTMANRYVAEHIRAAAYMAEYSADKKSSDKRVFVRRTSGCSGKKTISCCGSTNVNQVRKMLVDSGWDPETAKILTTCPVKTSSSDKTGNAGRKTSSCGTGKKVRKQVQSTSGGSSIYAPVVQRGGSSMGTGGVLPRRLIPGKSINKR